MPEPTLVQRLRAIPDDPCDEARPFGAPEPKPVLPTIDDVQEIAKLTAQGVTAQYEAAAQAVEKMGEEVKDRIAKLEAALAECNKDMKTVAEAAAAIREKGKLVALQIEEASVLSKDIRNACADFGKRVGA